jgi:hypothetical protein
MGVLSDRKVISCGRGAGCAYGGLNQRNRSVRLRQVSIKCNFHNDVSNNRLKHSISNKTLMNAHTVETQLHFCIAAFGRVSCALVHLMWQGHSWGGSAMDAAHLPHSLGVTDHDSLEAGEVERKRAKPKVLLRQKCGSSASVRQRMAQHGDAPWCAGRQRTGAICTATDISSY